MSGIFLLVVISWSFERIVVDEANTPFHGVWVDKINNDNKYDILGTKYGFSVAVSWYEQTSNIYNWLPHPINTSVAAVELASADLDGDSDRDVVYNASDSSVWVARNDGNGSFINHLITNAGHKLRQIRFADIDGDGDLDFVVGSDDSISPVFWFENMGGLSFIQYTITSDSIFEPWKLDVGDINGDGDVDIVVSGLGGSELFLFDNNGSGGFTQSLITSSLLGPGGVKMGDLNNDGKLDIAVCEFMSGGRVIWYENTGSGFNEHLIQSGINCCDGLDVGDMDLDGDLEIVVCNYNTPNTQDGKVLLFENTGGNFLPAWSIDDVNPYNTDLPFIVDIDEDSCPDVVISDNYIFDGSLVLYRQLCNVPAEERSLVSFYCKVYPEPASNKVEFQISLPNVSNCVFKVYDIMGRLVYKHCKNSSERFFSIIWNTSHVASGVYFYRIMAESNEIKGKFVIL